MKYSETDMPDVDRSKPLIRDREDLKKIQTPDFDTVGRFAQVTIAYGDVREACRNGLAPTTSSTLSLAIGDALATGGPTGKRVEFLLQEVLRELNTSGAKITDPSLTTWVVSGKEAVEKLREQVQNVE